MSDGVPPSLFGSYERLRIQAYVDFVAATILFWEYLITINYEATLIWTTKMSAVKCLFFFARYIPFIYVPMVLNFALRPFITERECSILYHILCWGIVLGIIASEVILVIRTWAIWERSLKIGILLAIVAVSCIAPSLYSEYAYLKTITFHPNPNALTPGCGKSKANPIIAVGFVLVIISETFVLILTLVKFIEHYRIAGIRGFFAILYRDGIMFYAYLLVFSLLNLILIASGPHDPAHVLITLQGVLHSCLSTRVLLNLREAQMREHSASGMSQVPTLQHAVFAHTEGSDDLALSDHPFSPNEHEMVEISTLP